VPRTFTDDTKELLEKALEDYKNEEPISAGALNSTMASGVAAVISAVAAGVGSIFAATKGAPASVVIAILAIVAVSVLALALVIRSDHQARAAVTTEVIRSIPKLIPVAHESEAPPGANGTGVSAATAVPLAAFVPVDAASSNGGAIPVDLEVEFKGDVGSSKVIAVRPSPKPEMYALRPGADRFAWVSDEEVERFIT
jgi:hypothetical protein